MDEPGISVGHIVYVLRSYRTAIVLSLLAIGLACAIGSIAIYLRGRQETVTAQTFRLDFEGAGEGKYPNGTRFSTAEIIGGPTLLRAYNDNHLSEYLSFGDFSRSIFVLESNEQYELLAAEYQARLADPKLTAVDRERIQREFEEKRLSIAKNDYAISFTRRMRSRNIPEVVVRKVLLDVLSDWADFAVNNQHAMQYQVSILSPQILKPSAMELTDPVAGAELLRSKINRVITNIGSLQNLPGANLARTAGDRLSLEETRLRLEEMIRFRLDPLLAVALHSPGLVSDRSATLRFLELQLAYDQRELDATQRYAQATRDALAIYEQPTAREQPSSAAAGDVRKPEASKGGAGSEALMPQLSDTFLDRLMTMTARGADVQFRQKLIDDYRKALDQTIPLQQAISYDTEILQQARSGAPTGPAVDPASVRQQLEAVRADASSLITTMNELFAVISRNISPSTQLFTITAPPTTRAVSAYSLSRLLMYSILLILISIPVILALCLLHHRIREEEALEEEAPSQPDQG